MEIYRRGSRCRERLFARPRRGSRESSRSGTFRSLTRRRGLACWTTSPSAFRREDRSRSSDVQAPEIYPGGAPAPALARRRGAPSTSTASTCAICRSKRCERAIGYAQQDAFLFSTTVAKNIGFALAETDSPDALSAIRERARDAQVLDETLRLPDGFDTVVGERGVQLSGGQKQRIALARALVWQPRILILDDPISAVDARTEAAILDTIGREAERRTVLLITHRVAAAERCDQIVVLDGGRVVEQGTHEELVRAGGLYARFAEEQRLEGELEELEADVPAAALGAP